MLLAALRPLLRRVQAIRKRNTSKTIVKKTFDAALRRLLRTEVDRMMWLDRESMAQIDVDPDFTFGFLTAERIAFFAQDPAYYLDEKLAARILDGRDFCFAALKGDRLAAFVWFALECIEPEHADGVAISYPSDVAFVYFAFTHPDFRGRRLHSQLKSLALQAFAARGVRKLVSIVGWSNVASLKSCRRLGHRDLGPMVAIGGKSGAFGIYPRQAKALGVKFGKDAARRPASDRMTTSADIADAS